MTQPRGRLREAVLANLEFKQRLVGSLLHPRLGYLDIDLYGFSEVVGFLCKPNPVLDLGELQTWLFATIGDHELAGKVAEVDALDLSYFEKAGRVRDLLALRLSQCLEPADHEDLS
ncbi:MAG: hypothetical protein A2V67_00995 [Deltaproteobacteria bacterium RBG_13_61_14]|nr:MAG: hypothetical protein A2V67_00995 [Deltaproteobacteria bacterium RBG_13_61_14]